MFKLIKIVIIKILKIIKKELKKNLSCIYSRVNKKSWVNLLKYWKCLNKVLKIEINIY